MSKIRIYLEPERIANIIKIGDNALIHKIKNVLRLKSSDIINIFDGCGKEYVYTIKAIAKQSISLEKDKLLSERPASNKNIALGFPIVKEERIDFILQKAAEFGVTEFIPFVCERSLRQKVSANKLKRWRRIIIEAVRQSERLWLPKLEDVHSFKDLIESDYQVKLAGYVTGKPLEKIINKKN